MRVQKAFLLPLFLLLAVCSFGQQKPATKATPPPLSPPATAETTVHGKKISIAYSRPSMRGRKIMGGLVPYGQVWRTGANSATTLTTDADLTIGGVPVPKGTYTLYSLPSDGTWKLIINKETGQSGTKYDQSQDLARVDMRKDELSKPVETFQISFEPEKDPQWLILQWEKTKLSVPVAAQ